MSNPKFLGVDLSIPTFTWSVGVDASYPVSNLKNYYPDSISKANTSGSDQYITIDFGAPVSCNAIIIDGHNFVAVAADSDIKLQTNTNDDTNWADAVNIVTLASPAYTNATIFKSFNAVSKRYWRILFSNAVSIAPQFGNIFLGTTLDFEKPQQWGCVPQMPSHNVNASEALDGRIRSAVTAGGRYNWEIEFKLQSDSFVSSWRSFLNTVKNNGVPFYYIDTTAALWCVVFEENYNPTTMYRYNQNDTAKLKLKTILANY